jgi:hypothetical protein
MMYKNSEIFGRLLSVFFVVSVFLGCGLICSNAFGDITTISVNGMDSGRAFDGIGALSAGASSRLLIDYPEKQRSEILDYLFKPDFGAGLQINKVEIGGDMNSTDGSEASHGRTPTDHNYHRGYEWWLMVESKKRNANEKLYILEWGAPGWINPGQQSVWTDANSQYIIDFIKHAKSDYGLSIDYAGGWNERGYDKPWYEEFRKALNDSGCSGVKVVGDDSFSWTVGADISGDQTFASAVDIIGQHYPDSTPAVLNDPKFQATLKTGKPIWFSEMGSQGYDNGAYNLAKTFNQSYIDNRVTANINWSTIWSVYSGLPYDGDGLMLANEPWSGHYYVGKSIWVCAHTTQFVQPGWQYLDGGCGFFGGKPGSGSYVTLKSPNGLDYSIIAETLDAHVLQTASFNVSGGLSNGVLHVWATNLNSKNSADWFVRQPDISPSNGAFTADFKPGFVYSLTTTTGQSKGAASSPASKVLPLPYKDSFAKYSVGSLPKYFSDQMGAFEIAPATGGRQGNCLRQVVTSAPVFWDGDGDPSTVVGDWRWQDYTVSSDVLLEQPGYVDIVGRMQSVTNGNSNVINGYHLRVTDTGSWSIIRKVRDNELVLSAGIVPFSVNTWHSLKLEFSGTKITGTIDGAVVAKNVFGGDFERGLAGYEVSRWQNAEFQNFVVTAAPTGPVPAIIRPVSAAATSENSGYSADNAIDNDLSTMWHTKFDPAAEALPQSITLDLGKVRKFDSVYYYPRTDGNPNGNITQYMLEVSLDNSSFAQVSSGQWADDDTKKTAHFPITSARYIRLTAVQGHGGYASASEVYAALSPGT